ncbi:NAD-dependent succinate-semialdehyde dehydrogenase [Aestuariirhabdus sp. LZHN29]|uniref:NAD-dependent succinate-semialdehyde dehydrogenase n=1 Tax=Aestuariirhabdus sp. LZHN29 TaxID=3417462 RepID=UPI003CF85E15
MLALNDGELLRTRAYIDGQWVNADSEAEFSVFNPANGELLTRVADLGAGEARRAIEAAHRAGIEWRQTTAKHRATLLRRWFELIMDNQEDLARIMTAEQGKPLAEARGEVAYGASFVEWFAEEAKRVYGDTIPTPSNDKRLVTIRQPIGVVAAITPWNFPNAMITRKVAPALAAGCTTVVKPGEDTPLSALALAALAERAGIPAGVFNVITTNDAPSVGNELSTNPVVRKLSFTGSTRVGKLLMSQCAGTVKKVALELGGNAPFIVFDDADLDAAIVGAMASKYRNAGQTCVCANRFLVQEGVYEEFARRLEVAVAALKVGDGFEEGVTTGPLINRQAREKVTSLVEGAVAEGAKVVCGGDADTQGGNFYPPTLLTGVTQQMTISNEEIFGPVATLIPFSTEQEAIAIANDTPYGLAAYFYSRDIGRVWRVSEGLEYGIVGINEGIISTEVAPFGGVKESGIGREGSRYGIDDFVEIKYLCMGGI